MKLGPIEGTAEEVKDFFENNGLNLSEYIEKPDPTLNKLWIILPSIIYLLISILLIFWETGAKIKTLLIVMALSSTVWISVSVHIRFKTPIISGSIGLAGVLILLVALGVISLTELIEQLKGLWNNG